MIKPAATIAAFLSIKNPFRQGPGVVDASKKFGKEYFKKDFCSDHFADVQAYVEWRRESLRGRGDELCEEQQLSPETLDMAFMMVQQFVSFMVEAGYDGADVGEGDCGEVDPIRKASDVDCLLRAAMVAGFMPSLCCLFHDGNKGASFLLDSNEEVSPFRQSANANYRMAAGSHDGDEWMVFSDAMKLGRHNSIMDSTLVFSPFILLFANAVLIDEQKSEIRFDKWYASINKGPWIQQLLSLRKELMPKFKDAIESRDLAVFPEELTRRIATFLKQPPISLKGVEACPRSIDEEVMGPLRRKLSIFEWPDDLCSDEDA